MKAILDQGLDNVQHLFNNSLSVCDGFALNLPHPTELELTRGIDSIATKRGI